MNKELEGYLRDISCIYVCMKFGEGEWNGSANRNEKGKGKAEDEDEDGGKSKGEGKVCLKEPALIAPSWSGRHVKWLRNS